MSMFVVTQGDLPLLEARVTLAEASVLPLLNRALEEVGRQTTDDLAAKTPVGTGRTGGHLASSYGGSVADGTLRITTTQAEKLNWVRYGTGIYGKAGHPIVPLRAKALMWPEAPHPMASVRGQRADDFVSPIFDDLITYMDEQITPFADQLLTILRGG